MVRMVSVSMMRWVMRDMVVRWVMLGPRYQVRTGKEGNLISRVRKPSQGTI